MPLDQIFICVLAPKDSIANVGIISKTYHSSSQSRAKFHSYDDGHLVRPGLGNVFNAQICVEMQP